MNMMKMYASMQCMQANKQLSQPGELCTTARMCDMYSSSPDVILKWQCSSAFLRISRQKKTSKFSHKQPLRTVSVIQGVQNSSDNGSYVKDE